MNPVAKKEKKNRLKKTQLHNWRAHRPEWDEAESPCSSESLLQALFRVKGISVYTLVTRLILL